MGIILTQNEYFIYMNRSKRLSRSKENLLPTRSSLLAASKHGVPTSCSFFTTRVSNAEENIEENGDGKKRNTIHRLWIEGNQ